MTPKLDLAEIERRAKAATQGPWYFDIGNGQVESHNENHYRSEVVDRTSYSTKLDWHNQNGHVEPFVDPDDDCEFIASCSPDVVLEMVRRLRGMQRALEEIDRCWDTSNAANVVPAYHGEKDLLGRPLRNDSLAAGSILKAKLALKEFT